VPMRPHTKTKPGQQQGIGIYPNVQRASLLQPQRR
jgi:hypothetical protein